MDAWVPEYKYLRVITNRGPFEMTANGTSYNLQELIDTTWIEPVEMQQVRWCATHNCEHYGRCECTFRTIELFYGTGIVNPYEAEHGMQECREVWVDVVKPSAVDTVSSIGVEQDQIEAEMNKPDAQYVEVGKFPMHPGGKG